MFDGISVAFVFSCFQLMFSHLSHEGNQGKVILRVHVKMVGSYRNAQRHKYQGIEIYTIILQYVKQR